MFDVLLILDRAIMHIDGLSMCIESAQDDVAGDHDEGFFSLQKIKWGKFEN